MLHRKIYRNSYLEYTKLYRFIKIELGLPRRQRIVAKDLLKIVNDMFERLNEISNLLPDTIVNDFKKKHKKNTKITRPGNERQKPLTNTKQNL